GPCCSLLLLALGCSSTPPHERTDATGSADGGPGGTGGTGLPGTDAAANSTSPTAPGPGEACVEQPIKANLVPLDLVLVLDASGSMRQVIGAKSRWQWIADALTTFVND